MSDEGKALPEVQSACAAVDEDLRKVRSGSARQREALIERALTYLTVSDPEMRLVSFVDGDDRETLHALGRRRVKWLMDTKLTYFNEAELTWAYRDFENLTRTYTPQFFDGKEVSPSDLAINDWDVRWFGLESPSATDIENEAGDENTLAVIQAGIYAVNRIRRVPLSEVRGAWKLKTGVVVESAHASIYPDGKYTPHREYLEKWPDGHWYRVAQPMEITPLRAHKTLEWQIERSKSVAFTRYYDWRVILGCHPEMPTLSFITDPVGCREIFRLRDIPPGTSRRQALRHWVSSHWRKYYDDDQRQVLVKEYLRGATKFTWKGLYVEVKPSKFDLKRAERAAEARKK